MHSFVPSVLFLVCSGCGSVGFCVARVQLTVPIVYFIYPETANLRLEDMDKVFGDATTAMPTPAQEAEIESLMSASRSPVPSLDIRRPRNFVADNAIPGLDIDPPKGGEDGKEGNDEGFGGWISRIVRRNRAGSRATGDVGSYRQLDQDERRAGNR